MVGGCPGLRSQPATMAEGGVDAQQPIRQRQLPAHCPLDIDQPLHPGAAPAGRGDQINQPLRRGATGERQRGPHRLVVVPVVTMVGAAHLVQPAAGAGSATPDRTSSTSPHALQEQQSGIGSRRVPAPQCPQRIGQRPQQVPGHHRVPASAGWQLVGSAGDRGHLQVLGSRVGAQPFQHRRCEIDRCDDVAELGGDHAEGAGTRSYVEHSGRRWWQQPGQHASPGRPLQRGLWVVAGHLVVGRRGAVPVAADPCHDVCHLRPFVRFDQSSSPD